ncbi:hypothetical protein TWF281_006474 [Arthrobotrys megalospora]
MAIRYCDSNAANILRNTFSDLFRWESYMPLSDFIQHRYDIFASLQLPENEAQISEILRCDCNRCNRYPLSDTPGDPRNITNLIARIRAGAIGIYALCVFLRYSRLIIPLLENGVTDENLNTIVRSDTDLRDLADFEQGEADIISSFVDFRGKFITPVIRRSDPHLEVANIRVLPFSLPPNGRSGEIVLPNRYNALTHFDPSSVKTSFYITRSRTYDEDFSSEKFRYEWLRKELGGTNLMEMLFSFRLQDHVYVVYEKAESNLKAYLEDPPVAGGDHRWLLEQFGCVIDAIGNLQRAARDYTDSTATAPSTEFYGVHFNLEPSKLLISRKGGKQVLLVTGFGRQMPRGVSDYTPPEASDRQVKNTRNQKYHVWSLGLILLDIIKCVQVITIANGRSSLGRHVNGHGARQWQAYADDASRSILSVQPSATPKELISLREKWKTDTLMCGRLDLVRDMVEVNFRHRPSLRTVSRIYKHLFEDRKSDIDTFIVPGDNEREVGLKDIHWLRLFEGPRVSDFGSGTPMNDAEISAFFARNLRRCRVQIFEGYRDERPTPELRITSIAHREEADLISQINTYRGPGGRPNERVYLWFVRFATRHTDSTNGEQNGARDTTSAEKCALSICNNFYVFDQMIGAILELQVPVTTI